MQVSSPLVPYTNTRSTTATSGSSSSTMATATGGQTLGVNDFMKLLATQFQQQDPLQPMDDTAFIAQTAQFTALQQTTTLTQNMAQMAASTYIGNQVTMNTASGKTVTGVVSAVDTSGNTPNLIVNGASYPLSALLMITTPPTSSGTAAANTSAVTGTAPAVTG